MNSSSSSGDLSGSSSSLTSQIRIFGLRLYVLLVGVFALCLTISFAIILLCIWLRRRSRLLCPKRTSGVIPLESKEIVEFRKVVKDVEKGEGKLGTLIKETEVEEVVDFGCGKGKKCSGGSDKASSSGSRSGDVAEVQGNIGWGRWYTLEELEIATGGFSEDNVIGEGGYGIVYRGVLDDGSVIAVKNLLNNKYASLIFFFTLQVHQSSNFEVYCCERKSLFPRLVSSRNSTVEHLLLWIQAFQTHRCFRKPIITRFYAKTPPSHSASKESLTSDNDERKQPKEEH